MKSPNAIRLIVADDHILVRQGIRAFLETEADLVIVGEAHDAASAIALCAAEKPDVALIDLVMPGGGVQATSGIKSASPSTAVIMLTSFEDDEQALAAIQAGALSYLFKDVVADELAIAIRSAARHEATLHPRIAARLVNALRNPSIAAGSAAALSDREREVLLLIAEGLSNAKIAERLGIGEKTVKTHVSNLLGKLGVIDRTQAAVYAWRHRWVSR
jgi:two-component system, NarL family, response regulator LiaR